MKKLTGVLALLLVLVTLFTFVACDPDRYDDDDDTVYDTEIYVDKEWTMLEAKHEKAVNITMWIPNSATSTMGTAITSLVDKFNAEQQAAYGENKITVTVEFQGTNGALNTKLQAAILAGNNPVINALGVSSVPLYGDRAVDLRTVFTYDELKAQQQGLFQYSMYEGKFMFNPYFPSASNIIVANKTMMEAKGITVPSAADIVADPDKSTWTWDNFKQIAATLTDKENGVYGFAANSLDPVGMMYQQGGSLYNSTVTAIEFDKDDKFKKGLEFWKSLVTEGLMINPTSRANHNSIIVTEFYEQKAGMIYTTSSNLVKFTEEAEKANIELEVLPFPKQTQYFTNQGGSGIVIFNNKPIEEQEAAAEFLKWLNKPENIAEMCAVTGYLPLDLRANDEQALIEVYEKTPLLKKCAELMKFGVKASQGKAKSAADKAVNDYAKRIWSEPDTPIDEIIAELIEKVLYEIDANK